MVSAAHSGDGTSHVQQTTFERLTSRITTPMPAISEDNEEMMISAPLESK
jgi:hypothetical protein